MNREGQSRRARRGPFLLAIFIAVLGFVGFSQLNVPLTQLVSLAKPTFTPTKTIAPAQTHASTKTFTPTRTLSPTATSTATRTPTLTATFTAAAKPTRKRRSTRTSTPAATATPTNTPAPVLRTARVPILMYHHVGELPPDADAIRKSLTISQERFNEQLKFLADEGYTTIHVADLLKHLQTGAPLPPKPIILTFDDGYDDNYTNVFPTLKDFGFEGTFFVIGAPTDYGSPGYLRWEQILEMYENGMEFGAHSLTHRYNLGRFPASIQDREIKPAHQLMVDHLPNWTPLFSYPAGSYNPYTLKLMRELGYIGAVTTKQGSLQSSAAPFELHRIRIRGEWSMAQFLYWFQYYTQHEGDDAN